MTPICRHALGVLLLISGASLSEADAQWPGFLGPQGAAKAPGAHGPLEWSSEEGIRWTAAIHGRGWSSPVTDGERVWVTTATEDGTRLSALCLDANSGEVLFDEVLFEVDEPQFAHRFNSYASPSPLLDGDRVYITFGSPGTTCLDTRTFERLWSRTDLECDHFRGAGSSPVLHQGLLILHYDGADHQYVNAFDARTGETVWRTDRSVDFQDLNPDGTPQADGDFRKGYSTPSIVRHGDRDLLLSPGSKAFYIYDAATGEELGQHVDRSAHSVTGHPLSANGLAYTVTGFSKGLLLALDLDGLLSGAPDALKWSVRRNVPNKPSPILHEGILYMIDDGGIATAMDASTGETLWNERIGGNYSASPLLIGDRLYFFSEEGKTTITRVGRVFEVLAENELGDGFMGTPAVLGDDLILRSRSAVYRISALQ